jgi:hypothetical protein
MTRDELGHLEHAHLAFAIKNRAQVFIGINLRPLLFVLKAAFGLRFEGVFLAVVLGIKAD